MKKIVTVTLLALCSVTALFGLSATKGYAPQSPFRIHVVANSDSTADQEVKLDVRDALLQSVSDVSADWDNKDDAMEYVSGNIEQIEELADAVLAQNGFSHTATAQVGNFHFPDRTYGDVLYPEGYYDALKITLGAGAGENWWCVLFPTFCIINPELLNESEKDKTTEEQPRVRSALFDMLFG